MLIKRTHDQLVLVVGCVARDRYHALLGRASVFVVVLHIHINHLVTTYLTRAHSLFGGDEDHRTRHKLLLISLDYFELLTLLIMTVDICPNAVCLGVEIVL